MPLQKQNINIPFAQGVDTKTDPNQIPIGKFLSLQNSVFNKGNQLTKRNGFQKLTNLSASNLNTLTTYNGNLTAIGQSLYAFSADSEQWFNKGNIESVQLSTLPLVRSSTQQTTVDVAVTSLGLCCTVWVDSDGNNKYEIIDSTTGQVIVSSVNLPSGSKSPRVFTLGPYFIVTFLVDIAATTHLRYIAIPVTNVANPAAAVDISTVVFDVNTAYDGQIVDNRLYIAWNASDVGGAVRICSISSTLTQSSVVAITGHSATKISVCGDTSGTSPKVWISFYESGVTKVYTKLYSSLLASLLALTEVDTGVAVVNLTSFAINSTNTVFYEINNTYSYSSVRSDYIKSNTVTDSGTVGTPAIIIRSVGLASKAAYVNSKIVFLTAYAGTYEPTYFLVESTGKHLAKLAFANGGGYPSTQVLSNAVVHGSSLYIGYLFKAHISAVNKETTGAVGGLFGQLGVNLAKFVLENAVMPTAEIGGSRHFASGFLWMFDGTKPVEHGFHLYPEDIGATTSNAGGSLEDLQYYYQVTYEWTDSQGNIHRSAPSIPVSVDCTAGSPASNSNTLKIPTLRVTYKTGDNVPRIVIYRWSTNNQEFYRVTSITSPQLNSTTSDFITYVDTQADSSIIGNDLIYTTGGVIENIGAPACNSLALHKSRLWLINAEDTNSLWYSKQVIEATPVEMSDLQTVFVAPTTGSQGSTGPCTVLSSMDDKLIIFKKDAIYYLTGNGPDNTGANNDYVDTTFITSTVGCTNNQSTTFMPNGLMFQSDKGIWLLGRDLSSSYIGAPVDGFNSFVVNSALTIPGTNQVRFTLTGNGMLVYDYYYNQWDEFTNIPSISSCLYEGLHTLLNPYDQVLQETPGLYLDGSNPVLMKFQTGWLNLAGLQGYERAYFFYLLGKYLSPHKLQVEIAYDYDPTPKQTSTITPDNYSSPWGGDTLWGGVGPWGGNSSVEQWRVFLQQQKCEAFQITVTEIFDSTVGASAGAGLTLSGINLVVGAKSSYPRLAPSHSVG